MIQKMRTNQKGFTLIELMIVVAIIGILAAIAIPNFLQYQLKSKTAEAKTNIGSIRTSQEAFKAEYDYYATCTDNPGVAGVGTAKVAWVAAVPGDGWTEIGYAPAGNVYYSYEVSIGGNTNAAAILTNLGVGVCGDAVAIAAAANLDGNATNGEFVFITDNQAAAPARAAQPGNLATAIAGQPNNAFTDLVPGSF